MDLPVLLYFAVLPSLIVELREPQAVCRRVVEHWRLNLTAVAAADRANDFHDCITGKCVDFHAMRVAIRKSRLSCRNRRRAEGLAG